MKLPGIQYGGVQSLGRENFSSEMKATLAGAQVMESVAGAIQAHEQARDGAAYNEGVAKWFEEDARLRSTLTESESLPVNTLPQSLVRELGLKGEENVETYRVASQLYDLSETKFYDEYKGKIKNKKTKAEFDKAIFRRKSQTISEINTSSIRRERDANQSMFDSALSVASKLTDRSEAEYQVRNIVNSAFGQGIYTAEQRNDNLELGLETVDYGHFQRELQSDDVEALTSLQDEIVMGDNFLNETQVKDLSAQYNSKIEGIKTKRKAEHKAEKTLNSQTALTEAMMGSLDGGAMTLDQIRKIAPDLEPTDLRTLLTWTKTLEDENKAESEKGGLDEANYLVTTLINGGNRQDVSSRLKQMLDTKQINGTDYAQAMGRLSNTQNIVFNAPQFKETEDSIYRLIVKAGKDQFLPGSDPSLVIYLNDALKDYYSAGESQGINFNPVKWWEVNQGKYLPPAHDEAAYSKYIILDTKSNDSSIDYKASLDAINRLPDIEKNYPIKEGAIRYLQAQFRAQNEDN